MTALRTLTILPVPGRDAKDLSSSLLWFPVTGLILGALISAVPLASSLITENSSLTAWPQGSAVLMVFLSAALTRGLHLDGLADFTDGFWGSYDKEKILRIMKDSSTGAFGAIALVLVLLAKYACFARMLHSPEPRMAASWIIAAYVLSRSMQALLAISFPYARKEGGTGELFIKPAGPAQKPAIIALCLLLMMLCCGLSWIWLLVTTAGTLIALLLGRWSCSKIDGITGDTLGAFSEIIETSTLAAGAWLII